MKITVYGASSSALSERHVAQGRRMGQLIAERGWTAVNGGGSAGIMGAVTDGALDAGGRVTGIIPMFMVDRGLLYDRLTDVVVAADMAQRKQLLADGAAAIIVMAGGIGTYDEFFEAITLRQLQLIDSEVVVVNVDGYFDPMIAMLQRAADEHLMRGNSFDELFTLVPDADAAIAFLDKKLKPREGR